LILGIVFPAKLILIRRSVTKKRISLLTFCADFTY
jgi:hypothetical protein